MKYLISSLLLMTLTSACIIDSDKSLDTKNHSLTNSIVGGYIFKGANTQPKFYFSHLIDKSIANDTNEGVNSVEVKFVSQDDKGLFFENTFYSASIKCIKEINPEETNYLCEEIEGVLLNKQNGSITSFEYMNTNLELAADSKLEKFSIFDSNKTIITSSKIRTNGKLNVSKIQLTQIDPIANAYCKSVTFKNFIKPYCRLATTVRSEQDTETPSQTNSIDLEAAHLIDGDKENFQSLESDDELIFEIKKPVPEIETTESQETEESAQE